LPILRLVEVFALRGSITIVSGYSRKQPAPGTTPQLFIRNTTGKPVDAALRFSWRSAGSTGPKNARRETAFRIHHIYLG